MSAAAELAINRLNTARFIAANQARIVLVPRLRRKDAYGTRWVDGTPRAPQYMRLIDQSSSNSPFPGMVKTLTGEERQVSFVLLGTYDALIAVGDYWEDDDHVRWEVAELLPENGYEQRAIAVRAGEA